MQVGRKPAATVVPLGIGHQTRPEKPRPPKWLDREERKLFKELVEDAPHLRISDIPLLANYVQASVVARDLVVTDPVAWAKLDHRMNTLARNLRLTAAGRIANHQLKKEENKMRTVRPWEAVS